MAEIAASPPPAWTPTPEVVDHAQMTELMRRHGCATVSELHRWSVTESDQFWNELVSTLDIRFRVPPPTLRGSDDPTDPAWFKGASMNIVDSCLDHAPDALAIVAGTPGRLRHLSVAQLADHVAAFVEGFRERGFGPGDRIAIVMPMTVEAVVAYLGTVAAGGVVVSIADSFSSNEIRARLGITQPVAVVTQDVSVRLGRELDMYAKCVEAGAERCIVVRTDSPVTTRDSDIDWDDFMVEGAPLVTVPGPASTHTNILFSSGTTGEPKAIPWTQTTPLKPAMDGRFHQDIHAGDVVAWPTNLGWMMGPWLIYASLLNGAAMALYDDAPTGRGFIDFVRDAHVTMLGVVPSIVSSWRTADVLHPGDWTDLRVMSSTGEASNPDDYRWLMAAAGGVPVVEYCGGTELGGGYIAGTVLEPAIPGCFTTPTLGLDFVILDDDGEESDIGEVFLVPPSIGMSTELLNRDHHGAYYDGVPRWTRQLRRHGDQLRRTEDGAFRVLGRVDDTMNLGGIKVSSGELEATIADVAGVREVAAIASPPPGGGPDRLVVFAVASEGGQGDAAALRDQMQSLLRTHLNPLFKIHEVVLVDSLPRTASHKIMRRTLRARYES